MRLFPPLTFGRSYIMARASKARRQNHRHQPILEILEDRCLLSFNEFPTLTASAMPWEITSGPDGNLWFAEFAANQIGRITPTGTVTEYPLPSGIQVEAVITGPDDNLWITE